MKNNKSTLIKTLKYCKPYKTQLIIAIICSILEVFFKIFGPEKIKDITNEIAKGLPKFVDNKIINSSIDIPAVTKIAFFILFIYIFSSVFNFIQSYIVASITQLVSKDLRSDIVKKMNIIPLSYFDSNSYGDLLSKITNDVDTIGMSLNQSLGTLISSIALFFGSMIMMFYNSFILTVAAILSSFLGFAITGLIMAKSQKFFYLQQENLGNMNGYIEEMYTAHDIVKAYNAKENTKAEFEKINDKLYDSAWKSQFLSGLMMPFMQFVGNLGYVIVCVLGSILAVKGYISFGVIVAFMIYIRLFTQPLSQIAQALNTLQRTAAAAKRVFDFLNEEELSDESHKERKLINVKGDVEFKNVHFGYNKDKIIINDFSAKIHAGQKVAIVGPTGAGKTTIINLIMRFYEILSGDILIDGISIKDVPRENVHEQFAMVLQDSWIFKGSIRENIVYSKENVSDKDLENACEAVGLHHFIKTLPNLYDTVLDEKTSISEGQKQLITIARAMIQNSPLLILDEATSSVDTRTEKIVQAAMDKLAKGRTSFVIAHRLSTIKNADLILVLKDGDIIEKGNHEYLLEKNGYYAKLYNSQFE